MNGKVGLERHWLCVEHSMEKGVVGKSNMVTRSVWDYGVAVKLSDV